MFNSPFTTSELRCTGRRYRLNHIFLGTTKEFRASLLSKLSSVKALDIAVAFITSEWLELLGDVKRPCRIVTWLTSTNTDPYAIDQMARRGNFHIRHRPGMHAKVYVLRGPHPSAIVGSANLSSTALSSDDIAGNIEAAIELNGKHAVSSVSTWFSERWADSSEVTPSVLTAAKAAYDKRPKSKPHTGKLHARNQLPVGWEPTKALKQLASDVRRISLRRLRNEAEGWRFLHKLQPSTMTKADLTNIVDSLVGWAGHRGAFAPVFDESLGRIRAAFTLALDKSVSVRKRFEALASTHKLDGLGLTAWTMILYWHAPTHYPPFNAPTKKFLKDMKLSDEVPITLSPYSYEAWCAFSRDLATKLRLPTAGHVDRMVWAHKSDMTYDEMTE
jgi:HKD family nuclease